MSQYNPTAAVKDIGSTLTETLRLSSEVAKEFRQDPKGNLLSLFHYAWRGVYLNYLVWKNLRKDIEEDATKLAKKTTLPRIVKGYVPLEQRVKFTAFPANLRIEEEKIDRGTLGTLVSAPDYYKIALVDLERYGKIIQGFRICYGEKVSKRLRSALTSGELVRITGYYTERNNVPMIRIRSARSRKHNHIDIA